MKTKSLNIFTRWLHIFRPIFIQDHVVGQPAGGPWKFWFFWNTIFALCATGFFGWVGSDFLDQGEAAFFSEVPDFVLDLETGTMSSDSDPVHFSLLEYIAAEVPGEEIEGDDLVVFFDMETEKYKTADLEDHEASALFTSEAIEAYSREEGIVHRFAYVDIIPHLDLPEDQKTLDKAYFEQIWKAQVRGVLFWWGVVLFFLFIWFWLCVVRLLVVLFWTFLAWIFGMIMKVDLFNFDTAFLSLLTFGVPLGLLQGALMINGVNPLVSFGLSFLFLLGLVGMNLREMKEKTEKSTH